jgi:hypothetical protein
MEKPDEGHHYLDLMSDLQVMTRFEKLLGASLWQVNKMRSARAIRSEHKAVREAIYDLIRQAERTGPKGTPKDQVLYSRLHSIMLISRMGLSVID